MCDDEAVSKQLASAGGPKRREETKEPEEKWTRRCTEEAIARGEKETHGEEERRACAKARPKRLESKKERSRTAMDVQAGKSNEQPTNTSTVRLHDCGGEQAELDAQVVHGALAGDSIDGAPMFDVGGGMYTGALKAVGELAALPFALRLFATSVAAKRALASMLRRRPALCRGAAFSRLGRSKHQYVLVFTPAALHQRTGSDDSHAYQADAFAFRIQQAEGDETPPHSIPTHVLFDDLPTLVGAAAYGEEEDVAAQVADEEEASDADADALPSASAELNKEPASPSASPSSASPVATPSRTSQSKQPTTQGHALEASAASVSSSTSHGGVEADQPRISNADPKVQHSDATSGSTQRVTYTFGEYEVQSATNDTPSAQSEPEKTSQSNKDLCFGTTSFSFQGRKGSDTERAAYNQVAAAVPSSAQHASNGQKTIATATAQSSNANLESKAAKAADNITQGGGVTPEAMYASRAKHTNDSEEPVEGETAEYRQNGVAKEHTPPSIDSRAQQKGSEQDEDSTAVDGREESQGEKIGDEQSAEGQELGTRKPLNWSELVASTAPATTKAVPVTVQRRGTQQPQQQSARAQSSSQTSHRVVKAGNPRWPQQQASRQANAQQSNSSGTNASSQQQATKRTTSAESSDATGSNGERHVREEFRVDSSKVGQVIGRKGDTINAIRKETGATIDILTQPDRSGNTRTPVIVRGNVSKVKAAMEYIDKLLAQPPHSAAQQQLQSRLQSGKQQEQNAHRQMADESETYREGKKVSDDRKDDGDNEQKKVVSLPEGSAKQLLGPYGHIHKWLQNESNTKIVISGSADRQAEIKGSTAAIARAEELIQSLLDKTIEPPAEIS